MAKDYIWRHKSPFPEGCCDHPVERGAEVTAVKHRRRATGKVMLHGEGCSPLNAIVKPWTRHYYGYIITLLSIIYIIDEVTSSIPGTVQSSIVNEFFVTARGMSYNTGLASFGAISSAFMVITVLAPFYKSLSDRFGRKPFLAINTAGMGLGLLICYTSTTLVLYLIGLVISVFFVAHDMQVVYIMEIAPPKWRGTMYASIKCVASLGVVLIPLLRSLTMGNDPTLWRSVYLVPGLLGLLFGLVTLLTAKETPYFLKHRPAFREQGGAGGDLGEKGERTDQKSGVIPAFKFMFAHRQLRWLSITNLIFFAAAAAIGYYESIMSRAGCPPPRSPRRFSCSPLSMRA